MEFIYGIYIWHQSLRTCRRCTAEGIWAQLGPVPTWAQGPLGPWVHLDPGPTWAQIGPGPYIMFIYDFHIYFSHI